MSRLKKSKLNYLLSYQPQGIVLTSTWLSKHGFYKQLVKKYCDNQWLRKIRHGAYARLSEQIGWPGAVYAFQKDLNLPIHVGGLTALELYGFAQNIVFNQDQNTITLFNTTPAKSNLPKWFREVCKNHAYYQHHLFQELVGLESKDVDGITLRLSSPERAILEVLDLVPNEFSYAHANNLVENLQLLRPNLMQELLEECTSIKVKRLFLYLADKYQLPCFRYLNVKNINLGRGKRVIGKGGVYIPQYQLSVPRVEGEEEKGIGYV